MNLGSYLAMNSLSVMGNPLRTSCYERKQYLPEKRLWRPYFSLKRNFWPSTLFLAERNSINIIFLPLVQQHCQEKHKRQAQGWQRSTAWAPGQVDVCEWAQIQ
jgi:hypothetical protein